MYILLKKKHGLSCRIKINSASQIKEKLLILFMQYFLNFKVNTFKLLVRDVDSNLNNI